MAQEIHRRIGAASAVKRSVVGKREQSQKEKLSIYRSIYILPSSMYGWMENT